VGPGCDVTPPEAPVILSPVFEEGASYISTPVILGNAEPFARVRVWESRLQQLLEFPSMLQDRYGLHGRSCSRR